MNGSRFCDRCNAPIDDGQFSGDFGLTDDRVICLDCRSEWWLLWAANRAVNYRPWIDKGLVRWPSRARARNLV